MEIPVGLIIVTQSILTDITQAEVIAALPNEWGRIPRLFCEVKPISVQHHEISSINWRQAAGIQSRIVKDQLFPLMEKYPDYLICYFGSAPIPLAMHLGYRIGTWKRIMVFQHHHSRKDWLWKTDEKQFTFRKNGFPNENFGGEGVAVIRIGTSYAVNEADTRLIVIKPVRDLEIFTDPYDLDIFDSYEKLSQAADEIRDGLDAIKNHLSEIQLIHLFAAIPVGLAFLLGTRINPTIHHNIQTYQYYQDKTPHYEPALIVQEEGQPEVLLTEEQIEKAAELRLEIFKMFDTQLMPFVQQIEDLHKRIDPKTKWVENLLPTGTNSQPFHSGRWAQLPHVNETILKASKIDMSITTTNEFYNGGKWMLDDRFLVTLWNRLGDIDKVKRAIRLFLFHEALHYRHHSITGSTANQVGRFSRILEEVDYQADVWAMLHEYIFSKTYDVNATQNVCEFFLSLITIATETMWSFDVMEDPDNMQARRINRYLIWYFHFVQVEHEKCNTLDDILLLLSEKPLIELKGLRINPPDEQQRIWCKLIGNNPSDLEIGILFNNRIQRFANGSIMQLAEMLGGLHDRDGEKIKTTLRSLFDQVAR